MLVQTIQTPTNVTFNTLVLESSTLETFEGMVFTHTIRESVRNSAFGARDKVVEIYKTCLPLRFEQKGYSEGAELKITFIKSMRGLFYVFVKVEHSIGEDRYYLQDVSTLERCLKDLRQFRDDLSLIHSTYLRMSADSFYEQQQSLLL